MFRTREQIETSAFSRLYRFMEDELDYWFISGMIARQGWIFLAQNRKNHNVVQTVFDPTYFIGISKEEEQKLHQRCLNDFKIDLDID